MIPEFCGEGQQQVPFGILDVNAVNRLEHQHDPILLSCKEPKPVLHINAR